MVDHEEAAPIAILLKDNTNQEEPTTDNLEQEIRAAAPESIYNDGATDLVETKVEEQIHHQTERVIDIIEDLNRLNRMQWSESATLSEGVDKLSFIKERLARIRAQTLESPDFLERRPMKNQPEYAYIGRFLKEWANVHDELEVAKNIVYHLPVNPGGNPLTEKRPSPLSTTASVSAASMAAEQRKKNLKKAQELTERSERLEKIRKSSANRGLPTETLQNNVEKIYGDKRGKAINEMLNRPPPSRMMKPKVYDVKREPSLVDQMDYGSYDGHLQIKDVVQDQKPKNRVEKKNTQESFQPRILPRGVTLEDFLANQKIDDRILDQDVQDNFSVDRHPTPYRQNRSTVPFSRPRTRHTTPDYYSRIPVDDDWISVKTKRHPQEEKPRHKGIIRKFNHLFEYSFQEHLVCDPYSQSRAHASKKALKIVHFDGTNSEFFREFEQGVLMKIINDETLDWGSKFYMLLNNVSGPALSTVQAYTDDLDMSGFVQALEDLYYLYGRTSHFRAALVRQLKQEAPIDCRKPETLQKINALLTRITRTFAGGNGSELMWSFILPTINMTEEASKDYMTWLITTSKERGLASFTQWLTNAYAQCHEIIYDYKPTKNTRYSRPPVLMETIEDKVETPPEMELSSKPPVQETVNNKATIKEELPTEDKCRDEHATMANQTNQMANRCGLCFGEKHKFADCRMYMLFTPDQRKLYLLRNYGCYICTEVGHTASRCQSQRSCQSCQSARHHETICNAAEDSWSAALQKKWEKPSKNDRRNTTHQDNDKETSQKTNSFLVETGEEPFQN